MKRYYLTVSSCLILALVSAATVRPVNAADSIDHDKPIRLFATAFVEPIGKVDWSTRAIINGRPAPGEQLIWAGDLIQAPANDRVHLSLDEIGEISLSTGALARLARTHKRFESGAGGFVLIASLVKGNMKVNLIDNAEAYIEAGHRALNSTPGAAFNVRVRDGEAVVETTVGSVESNPLPQARKYKIVAYGRGLDISVAARSSSEVQVRVTDAMDQPMPDVPVEFSLSKGIGVLGSAGKTAGTTVTVTTGPDGVASATFTAGSSTGSTSVTARAGDSSVSGNVNVSGVVAGGLSLTTKLLIGLGAGGAAAGAALALGGGHKQTQQSTPPPPTPQTKPVVFDPPSARP